MRRAFCWNLNSESLQMCVYRGIGWWLAKKWMRLQPDNQVAASSVLVLYCGAVYCTRYKYVLALYIIRRCIRLVGMKGLVLR